MSSSSSTSATLLCLFLLLGCIAAGTATEPETGNNFDTSSIGLWPRWWWRTHPKLPSPPTQSPSPIDNVVSPTHMAPSPFDDVVSPPHTAPNQNCIKVDGCASDLITSVFKRRISLSTQCCQVLSTISDDCFYTEYTHSKRVPFFLGKVRNYCSHVVDNAAPSPSPVDNAALPTHASPSPIDNVASPTHAAPSPSPSPVDDVVSPSHMAPSWGPGPAPTTSCIKVNSCAFNLITFVFKRRISLSTQCCQVLSTISDDCFYTEYTHSKRVPFFLGKVRKYCSHHHA
uniref:Prolamin-like domain-containing protein n=1 Tax=Solanum lycopersicum TaxID=4081 RepID=A0A3Q7GA93_SOLLC